MDRTLDTPVRLRQALRQLIREQVRTLVPPWSWKAAAFAAAARGTVLFVTNLKAGRGEATKALVVEPVFALFAAGLIGAISQQIRHAEPLWATVDLVCVCLPGFMLLAQSGLHKLAHTPHLSGGLVLSFLSFCDFCRIQLVRHASWRDVGWVRPEGRCSDVELLPKFFLGFLLAVPRNGGP